MRGRTPALAGPKPTPGAPGEVRSGLRARLFAWSLAHAGHADARLYGARKQHLFRGLGPDVLEIGAGAGPNAAYLAPGTRWTAIEPNVHFHPHLRRAAETRGLSLTVLTASAEALPLPDASADAVVSTLVLCSVADPARALAEVRRVLRPGGVFVFVEHVGAPEGSGLRRAQRLLRGPWGALADGCRPDRDTLAAIRAAGFSSVEAEAFRAPLALVAPHVAGRAVR